MQSNKVTNHSLVAKAGYRYKKGFTLIELLIVIAIMGVLASVAYPAYTSYVKKSNRADAIDTLLLLAGRMEEYYLNNDTYVGATVSGLLGSTTSSEGLYTMTISPAPTAFTYTLVATSVKSDPECLTLTLNQLGQKGSTGTSTTCW